MKILTIIGARPQFIKAAVLSNEIANHLDIEEIIVHTGQHYDSNMSDVFFNDMKIPKPKYNLHIQSKTHGEMTGMMMTEIEKVAFTEKPDWILVYGDTNSTLAGALVAAKQHIKLAHVEAGLRSFNMKMPEEINRILTDRISNILFCPSQASVDNLNTEGYQNMQDKKIRIVGDIMFDSALYFSKFATKLNFQLPENYALCTVHRAENTTEEKLKTIFKALNIIGEELKIIIPIHPRTSGILSQIGQNYQEKYSNILFIEPQGYLEMLQLIKNSSLVITDSGGLQKEAYFFQKKCLTLRDQTEWVELVDQGYNMLSEIDENTILNNFRKLRGSEKKFSTNIYGEGNTAEKIIEELKNY